jgi:restriction endonuclease Mrr
MSEKILIGKMIQILQKQNHPLSAKRLWEILKSEYDGQPILLGDQVLNPIKMQNYLSSFIKKQNIIIEPRTNVYYLKAEDKNHDEQTLNQMIDQIFVDKKLDSSSNATKASHLNAKSIDTISKSEDTIDVDVETPLDDLDVQIDEFGSRYQAFKSEQEGLADDEDEVEMGGQKDIEPLKLLSLIQAKSNIPAKIEAVQTFIKQNQDPSKVLWTEFQSHYQKVLNEFHAPSQNQIKTIEQLEIDLSPRQPEIVFPPPHLKAQILKIFNQKNHKKSPRDRDSTVDEGLEFSKHPDSQSASQSDQLPQSKRRQTRSLKNQIDLSLYASSEERHQQQQQDQHQDNQPLDTKPLDANDPVVVAMLQRVRQLTEPAFEKLVFSYLSKMGYYNFQKVHQQKGGRVAIYALSTKQQATLILAQLKSVEVETKTVNLLIDNLHHFNAQIGMIITTGDIQTEAYRLSKNKITLLDGQNFIQNLIKNEIIVQDES